MIILWIISGIIATALGTSKGYSGIGCFFAGMIGGIITIIVLLFLPNKIEEEEEREYQRAREAAQTRKINQLQDQVNEMNALKQRIRELEAAQKTSETQE